MEKRKSILEKLNDLDYDLDEKGSFIIKLGEHDKVSASLIEDELKLFFYDSHNYFWVRHASVQVLLFDLKIKDTELLMFVKKVVVNPNEDFELVSICLSGLGKLFFDEHDIETISFLYAYAMNQTNDISHRCTALRSCLNVLGYNSISIINKTQLDFLSDFDLSWFEGVMSVFNDELLKFINPSNI
mgnify:CR=1 FL=1